MSSPKSRWQAVRRAGPLGWLVFPVIFLILCSRFVIPMALFVGSFALLSNPCGIVLGFLLVGVWTWRFDQQAKIWLIHRAAMPVFSNVVRRDRKAF